MKTNLHRLGKCNKGFTLIEVIVVAAIIAILAGILVPMIFNQIDESKKTRALGDCKAIHTALIAFKKDTGTWPNKSNPTTANVALLYTLGTLPPDADLSNLGWGTSPKHALSDHLKTDDNGAYGTLWKGSYLANFDADPWGNAYIVSASSFNVAGSGTWILSMGPDGILQTNLGGSSVIGDDIGLLVK